MTAIMNRRALIGTIAVAGATPALLTGPAAAASPVDHAWSALVIDYRTKHAIWLTSSDADAAVSGEVKIALAQLPPKPEQPRLLGFGDMTISEWMAAEKDPARKAVWAAWQSDVDRWTAAEAKVRDHITAPAKARYDAAYDAYTEALNRLSVYPVLSLTQLAEKIEILVVEFDGFELPLEYFADVLADVRRLGGAV